MAETKKPCQGEVTGWLKASVTANVRHYTAVPVGLLVKSQRTESGRCYSSIYDIVHANLVLCRVTPGPV